MHRLKKLWEIWKRFGQLIGDFVGRVVMTIFYFTLFLPFGLASRLFRDPLDCKDIRDVSWTAREEEDASLQRARRLG